MAGLLVEAGLAAPPTRTRAVEQCRTMVYGPLVGGVLTYLEL